MNLRNFATSLRYHFAKTPPRLADAVRHRDAAMASYILECRTGDMSALALGHAMIWAGDAQGDAWVGVLQKIRNHPQADGIAKTLIVDALGSASRRDNVAMAAVLLSFPQVRGMTAGDWDSVLFECLPKGDPEKKRIENRSFTDRDGHPAILAMVRRAMAGEASPERSSVAPGAPIR